MVRPALHVPDAVAAEFLFKPRRATPGRVLSPLVGQDLPGDAIVGDPAGQGLQDQGRALMMRQHAGHDVAGVIVEEGRHVDPLVAAQAKGEQIRLPQLIRLSPLEAPRRRPGLRDGACDPWGPGPLGRQPPAHRRRRHGQRRPAADHVTDAPHPELRMRPAERYHGPPPRVRCGGPRPWPRWLHLQRGQPALPILPHPLRGRRARHPDRARDPLHGQPLLDNGPHHTLSHLERPHLSRGPTGWVARAASSGSLPRTHAVLPIRLPVSKPSGGQVLPDFYLIYPIINWRAQQVIATAGTAQVSRMRRSAPRIRQERTMPDAFHRPRAAIGPPRSGVHCRRCRESGATLSAPSAHVNRHFDVSDWIEGGWTIGRA